MTKIDIISGFLGAGKTTLIKKLLAEAYQGEKLVLIENEFGEISIDGGFLKESGVQISEMSSGCICCSLVGDFNKALKDVAEQFHPDRILIEPSGVGKLSDVIVAVENTAAEAPDLKLNSFVTVADASKVKVYMKNFGEFYNNQIESAGTIVLSRTQKLSREKLEAAVALLREKNPDAAILTTPWDELEGKTILSAIEKVSLADELLAKMRAEHEAEEAEHAHHHHDHGEHGDHEHRHGHGEQEECCHGEHGRHEHHGHGDHHHDHEEHGAHEHHHGHECSDPDCSCHHHHHHADEVFTSWGKETPKAFTKAGIEQILAALDSGEYGSILRAKGIVNGEDGSWIEFDFVPEEHEVRAGRPDYTGRLCVIGAELKEDKLARLFGL
ncbi:CobW family GTP-binding protein [uncultured Oscillibacter sp.]|uniref:CobW family GTP-binding protein n=1 Tax=uncultured Oscillibacter sp. TaxID=876091 RepID=UPI00261FAF49|nr:CobW family GTP-binding protein [uncultured Oscillibacter sp.]